MNSQTAAFLEQAGLLPEDIAPNIDDLITEDDTPLDNIFSEKQQSLLTDPLYSSWSDQPFVALSNVGLFYGVHHRPLVPDVLLSLGVKVHEDVWSKAHRAYFVWEFGKPPDIVIEVVSNKKGSELDSKLTDYAAARRANGSTTQGAGHRPGIRVREIIISRLGASRRASGKAWKVAHTRCMQPFPQRSQTGWIGVPR